MKLSCFLSLSRLLKKWLFIIRLTLQNIYITENLREEALFKGIVLLGSVVTLLLIKKLVVMFIAGVICYIVYKGRKVPLQMAIDAYEGATQLAERKIILVPSLDKSAKSKRKLYVSQIRQGIKNKKLILFGVEVPLKESKHIEPEDLELLSLSEDCQTFTKTDSVGTVPIYTNLYLSIRGLFEYIEEGKEL